MREIPRDLYPVLLEDFRRPEITLLTGARQVGKTYLLKKLYREASRRGMKARFFDLEQPDTLRLFNREDAEVLEALTWGFRAVFIDEFYYLKNASRLFKAVYDSGRRVKIFASGSSALEIHKHLRESLAGRKRIHSLSPCGLSELERRFPGKAMETLLVWGSLPGVVQRKAGERAELLADILQSYILKDVKGLIREENIRAFNHLLYLLAQGQGQPVSGSSLSRDIGLTQPTVEHHLDLLHQTRVLFPVPSFSRNLGNELRKARKYYLYDLGIRNMMLKDFRAMDRRPDAGALLESFVFLELNRRLDPLSEILFWRTKDGKEVDFILMRNRTACPVEVKRAADPGRIPAGLAAFLRRYPDTPAAFILDLAGGGDATLGRTRIHRLKIEEAGTLWDRFAESAG